MREVGRVVPALPVSLVASAILAGGEPAFQPGAEGRGVRPHAPAAAAGAHVHIPRHDQEYAVDVGLRMLMLRHLVSAEDGVYRRQSQGDARCSPSTPTPSPICCRSRRQRPAV